MTGTAVLEALCRRGVDALAIDPAEVELTTLPREGFDRVWIALHGPGGEDGTVQGALEVFGLPYTGTGVLGSALCMDKLRSKLLFKAVGLPTSDFRLLDSESDFESALDELGLPLMIKPVSAGSSVGMHKVEVADQLSDAFTDAASHGTGVLAEAWLYGEEYTAAVLHGSVLPLIRIETPRTFYDYEAKYFSDSTRYLCPCGLEEGIEQRLAALALKAFHLLNASGWGRVDFMLDGDGEPQFLEVNTVPGMTDHSLVPMAARQAGLEFDELVWRVLETSFETAAWSVALQGQSGAA